MEFLVFLVVEFEIFWLLICVLYLFDKVYQVSFEVEFLFVYKGQFDIVVEVFLLCDFFFGFVDLMVEFVF